LLLLMDSPFGMVRGQPYQNLGCVGADLQYYVDVHSWRRPWRRGTICTVSLPGGETHNIGRGCRAYLNAQKDGAPLTVHIQRALLTRERYYSIVLDPAECAKR